MNFSGAFIPVRSVRSAKSLKSPFFLSSRMEVMNFFPRPGSSSSMCLRRLIPSASLKNLMNLVWFARTMSLMAYSISLWALLVSSEKPMRLFTWSMTSLLTVAVSFPM